MTTHFSPIRDRIQVVLFRTLLASHSQVSEDVKHLLAGLCGLSMMQFDMIVELGGTEGMKMGDLSKKMITSPSSVTRIAQSLEKKGLVQRQRAEHSEREVLCQLTPKGEEFFEEHFGEVALGIADLFDSRLEEEEQRQLTALLDKLVQPTT